MLGIFPPRPCFLFFFFITSANFFKATSDIFMLISLRRIRVSTEVRWQQLSARQRFSTRPDKPSSSAQSSLFELIRGISADFNVHSAFQSMSRRLGFQCSATASKTSSIGETERLSLSSFSARDESIGKRINLSAIWRLHPPTHAHTRTVTLRFILSSWGMIRNSGVFRELGFEKLILSEREIKWVVVTITP